MNQTLNQGELSRVGHNSVEILFKGLKRKVSQRSYSKIKNSFKKKPIENQESTVPLATNLANRHQLKLSVVSNRILCPQQAHDQLIKLKQANHKLFEENTELLRKIRKQEKIQEIYRKKLQGKELNQVDYFRAMQIKLLLEVETLQTQLEEKEHNYLQKLSFIKTKKHSFKEESISNRIFMYELMINTPQDLAKIQKDKKTQVTKKQQALEKLHEQILKVKFNKNEKNQVLNKIKNEIKDLKEKFKVVEAQSRRDKNSSQMVNITSLMSSLMTNAERSQANKEASSAILKNNVSSISVKNRNNIEQLQKQIQKIKEEYDMINNEIQEFMDEKIKQKILIHKEIHAIEEKERNEKQIENRNSMCNGLGGLGRIQGPITLSRIERSVNPMKCSIMMG